MNSNNVLIICCHGYYNDSCQTVSQRSCCLLLRSNVLNKTSLPIIWNVLLPTLFSGFTQLFGPKHSNSIPSSAVSAVPLSVDEKEGPFDPNPIPGLAVRSFSGPQTEEEEVDRCERMHSLLPPTRQVVIPSMFPTTVHVKEKVSPEHVGGAAVSCPVTNPEGIQLNHQECMHRNKTEQTHMKCSLFSTCMILLPMFQL